MGFNAGLGMAGSYYQATAHPSVPAPVLAGEIEADVCVVGGGCTGLSAALHAAERGYSVVLLEGGRIGWGASGRNGGQIIPGLRKGAVELVARFGAARARRLFTVAVEACDLVEALIRRHGIDCDLKLTGHLSTVIRARDLDDVAAEVDCLERVMGYRHAAVLDAAATRDELAAEGYHGALLDRRGGHLHPLNYTLGLAEAARRAGVRIFEQSPVRALESRSGITATTGAGRVRARYGVLACDALLGDLDPRLAARIMPVANYIVATEPLADPAALIAHDRAVSDNRFVVNYFRLSADGRLLFGGGEKYSPRPPADMDAFVRPYLQQIFPQLHGVRIDYSWGGMVSVTLSRLPHIGRTGDLFFAHGYSGQGVVLTTLAGQVLAEAMAGTAERFDLFAGIAPPAFPGGTLLRGPLHVLGMLWYALRDRL
jgi:gamma-glutamylputrescine oxidase